MRAGNIFRMLISRISLTNKLIFANVVLFFAFSILFSVKTSSVSLIALQPSLIISGKNLWTLVTALFIHQNGFHLFVNMFSLFFLGNFVEKIIGKKRLFIFYLIAGIVGSIFFVLFAFIGSFFSLGGNLFGGVGDLAVGASGAIFGLLGLLAILVPSYKVYLILGPLVAIIVQVIIDKFLPASISFYFNIAISIAIFAMLFAMFSKNVRFRRFAMPVELKLWAAPIIAIVPLMAISLFIKLPIGNTAHLGGLIAGIAYGYYLKLKYRRKVGLLQKFFR